MNRNTDNKVDRLMDYLRRNLDKGYKKESLKWALVKQGQSRIEIDKAFKKLEEEEMKKASMTKAAMIKEASTQIEPIMEPERRGFWKKLFG